MRQARCTGFFAVLLTLSGLVLLIASVNVATMLLARAVVAPARNCGAPGARRRAGPVDSSAAHGERDAVSHRGRRGNADRGVGHAAAWRGSTFPSTCRWRSISRLMRARSAVTMVVALLTGIGFGLAPALQASRLDFAVTLRGDTSGGGRSRSRLRNSLIIGQVALSLVLSERLRIVRARARPRTPSRSGV